MREKGQPDQPRAQRSTSVSTGSHMNQMIRNTGIPQSHDPDALVLQLNRESAILRF